MKFAFSLLLSALCCFNNGLMAGTPTQAPQGFVENKGQVKGFDGMARPEVKFAWQQGSVQLFVLENGLAYQFTRMHYPQDYLRLASDSKGPKDREKLKQLQKQVRRETFRMDMHLKGANANPRISTGGKSTDHIHFYNHQVTDVHSFDKITCHDVYPGIDWVVYQHNGLLKYDFVIKPGADPGRIQLEFTHQESLRLNPDGSLSLNNRLGSITEEAPLSLQAGKNIATRFTLRENVVSFALGAYDASQPLTIDPALVWATYYGGADTDGGRICATDALGNVYLSGITYSGLGIASGGYQNTYGGNPCDAFLVKFNSAGTRLWATYYGGSDREYGNSCAVDAGGNVYLAGETWSPNNIGFNGHQNTQNGMMNAFLAKFSSSGSLLWGTYYGGGVIETGYSCATDALGNVYLAGQCSSTTNIASGGFQNSSGGGFDAFLVKFNSSGQRQWATYYGGYDYEIGYACTVDVNGNVYLAGQTSSTVSITSGGHQNSFGGGYADAFLVKFNAAGQRQWATYYGGNDSDFGYGCAADLSGDIYLCGSTSSTINIASGGHQNSFGGGSTDAFLAKFSSTGVRQWGTYYGDAGNESGWACTTDASGDVYLAGTTSSTANIAFMGYQATNGGPLNTDDACLVKFNGAGVRQWGTYYGGPDMDGGTGVATGPSGALYLAGVTSSTAQIASSGFQGALAGQPDAFLAKFCNAVIQPFTISGNISICPGSTQLYSVTPDPNASGYTWLLPAGWPGSSATNTISVAPATSGSISLYVTSACGANATQTLYVLVNPAVNLSVTAASSTICNGQTTTLSASGATTYTWNLGPASNTFVVNPSTTTSYTVTGTGMGNCTGTASFVLNVSICTGTEELSGKEQAKVYPNPTNGLLYLECSSPSTVSLYNNLGQPVMKKNLQAGKEQLSLNTLSHGIYYLELESAEGKQIFKLLRQ